MPRRGVRMSDCVLIAGMRGAGKSSIAAYLTAAIDPRVLIWVDPKHEWEFGVPVCRDGGDVERAWAEQSRRRGSRTVIHVVPRDCEDRNEMTELYRALYAIPGPHTHVEDEVAETTRISWAPPGLRSKARLGRADRKQLICCTQRLAECHAIVRTQATHVIVPAPGPPDLDLRMIAVHLGLAPEAFRSELEELAAVAGPYAHAWHVCDTRETRWMSAVPIVDWPARRGQYARNLTAATPGNHR